MDDINTSDNDTSEETVVRSLLNVNSQSHTVEAISRSDMRNRDGNTPQIDLLELIAGTPQSDVTGEVIPRSLITVEWPSGRDITSSGRNISDIASPQSIAGSSSAMEDNATGGNVVKEARNSLPSPTECDDMQNVMSSENQPEMTNISLPYDFIPEYQLPDSFQSDNVQYGFEEEGATATDHVQHGIEECSIGSYDDQQSVEKEGSVRSDHDQQSIDEGSIGSQHVQHSIEEQGSIVNDHFQHNIEEGSIIESDDVQLCVEEESLVVDNLQVNALRSDLQPNPGVLPCSVLYGTWPDKVMEGNGHATINKL